MELRQLRAFLAIAETGSVTKAAGRLHVVQPAISRSLRQLEDEFGATLFHRERRGMVLTKEGSTLLEHARRALAELDRARELFGPRSQEVTGSVVVGFLPSAADLVATRLMGRVRHAFPGILLRSHVAFVREMEHELLAAELDAALLYRRSAAIEAEVLVEEQLFLVGPRGGDFRMDQAVPLRELDGTALVLPARPHGLRIQLDEAFALAGISPMVVAETNAMSLQRSMVADGTGVTILPGSAVADELARGDLVAAPLDGPGLRRSLWLAQPADRTPSIAVGCVVRELRQVVRDLVAADRWPGATWIGS